MTERSRLLVIPFLFGATAALACSDTTDDGDDGENTGEGSGALEDMELCAPENGPFSLDLSNPYLPFPVGDTHVLEGQEAGEHFSRIEFLVLDETEPVAGVTTRVVEVTAYDDMELVEIAREYYAQAADGTVCFFGADEDEYEDGEVETDGWRHGEDDAHATIAMPGTPTVGFTFTAAYLPPDEVETSEITALGEVVVTPAGTFDDTVTILEEGPSIKKFAAGIGQIYDDGVELVEP